MRGVPYIAVLLLCSSAAACNLGDDPPPPPPRGDLGPPLDLGMADNGVPADLGMDDDQGVTCGPLTPAQVAVDMGLPDAGPAFDAGIGLPRIDTTAPGDRWVFVDLRRGVPVYDVIQVDGEPDVRIPFGPNGVSPPIWVEDITDYQIQTYEVGTDDRRVLFIGSRDSFGPDPALLVRVNFAIVYDTETTGGGAIGFLGHAAPSAGFASIRIANGATADRLARFYRGDEESAVALLNAGQLEFGELFPREGATVRVDTNLDGCRDDIWNLPPLSGDYYTFVVLEHGVSAALIDMQTAAVTRIER